MICSTQKILPAGTLDTMPSVVGVVSIQGDFSKHIEAVQKIGIEAREVRTPEELTGVDRIIIPGGESSAVGKLMERFGLGQALIEFASDGHPIWGTCMGMILMAREVEGHDQYRLGLLDICVQRNAFGAQVHSFESEVEVVGWDQPATGVFIRAPIVTECGTGVKVLSHFEGKVVAVQEGNRVGTSFHPELTQDTRFHEWFCNL